MQRTIQANMHVIMVVALACVLTLYGLDHIPVWQDEVVTALYGRSIVQHGIPSPDVDGNYVALDVDEAGKVSGITWAQYYVGALSQFADKDNLWLLRLPFGLAGLAAIIVTYLLGTRWFGPRAAMIGTILLLANTTFLLHMRQARYYPLSVALTLSLFWLLDGVKEGRWGHTLISGLIAALLFHTSPLSFLAVMPAMGALYLARAPSIRNWLAQMLGMFCVIALAVLPWLLYSASQNPGWGVQASLINAVKYVVITNQFVFPAFLLIALVGLSVWRPSSRRGWMYTIIGGIVALLAIHMPLLIDAGVISLIALALLAVSAIIVTGHALRQHPVAGQLLLFVLVAFAAVCIASGGMFNVRYMLPLFPAVFLLIGWSVVTLLKKHWTIPIILILMLGIPAIMTVKVPFLALEQFTHPSQTTRDTVASISRIDCALCKYIEEIAQDNQYTAHDTAAARYLASVIAPGDIVVGSWDNIHYAFMYYTPAIAAPRSFAASPGWVVTGDHNLSFPFPSSVGLLPLDPTAYDLVHSQTTYYSQASRIPDPVWHSYSRDVRVTSRMYKRTRDAIQNTSRPAASLAMDDSILLSKLKQYGQPSTDTLFARILTMIIASLLVITTGRAILLEVRDCRT